MSARVTPVDKRLASSASATSAAPARPSAKTQPKTQGKPQAKTPAGTQASASVAEARTLSGFALLRLQLWGALTQVASRLTRAEWGFVGLLTLCYAFFLTPAGTNTISRYDMVYALAHGTAIIDPHASNTIDVSLFNGHWYSPRSLGLSLLAVPILYVLSFFMDLNNSHTLTIQIAILNDFTVLPAAVIGALALKRFVDYLRPQLAQTMLPTAVAGAFALGTLAFPFSTTFFSHAFGGALVFIGFYLLYRARTQPQPWRRVLLAGLLVGFAVISEYPVGLVMVILGVYIVLVFPDRWFRMLVVYAAGLAPSALLLAWYDWFAFGNPLNFSYSYVADSAFAGQHKGFFGVTWPRWQGLWAILVYPRGLVMESPFLVLVPLGLLIWLVGSLRAARVSQAASSLAVATITAPQPRLKRLATTVWGWLIAAPEAWVCAAVCVGYTLAISGYFLPMAGENLPGPRLLVPMLAFACLPLAWVVDDGRRWLRIVFAATLSYGVAISLLYVATGVRMLSTYGAFPLMDLYWPILSTGKVPTRNGATPPSLTSLWFGAPHWLSLYLILAPLAIWTYFAVRAIVRGAPDGRPA